MDFTTEERQRMLVLARMVADKASGLTRMERTVGLHILKDRTRVPVGWYQRIEAYSRTHPIDVKGAR